ncbi:myb-like protein X [Anabrus simplex]|uniref:myb-like protein X n=1 Tax=Anabrus simplex TaxID=316456 RepID=UPI0035A2D379
MVLEQEEAVDADEMEDPIWRSEFNRALRDLNMNKACGIDAIPCELLTAVGETSMAKLSHLVIGQPEFTNEDLEDELTEVRPLDIPLQLLEVDDDDDDTLHYVTSTPWTLARPDVYFGEDNAYVHNHDRDEDSEHSGDSSTTPATYRDDDDDEEDEDDDDDDDDDENADENDSDDEDEDEDNDDSEEDLKADEDGMNTRKAATLQVPNEDERLHPTPSGCIHKRLRRNVFTVYACWQQWSRESTLARRPGSGRPRGTTEREDRRIRRMAVVERTASTAEIRAAVGTTGENTLPQEPGRNSCILTGNPRLGDADDAQIVTMAMHGGRVETTMTAETTTAATTTTGPGALMKDLEKFLGLTKNMNNKRNDNGSQKEAELDSGTRLDQVRELQRKVDIPQQLVDSVSPRADEGLLELMVKIAEDPAEWHRVHMQLQQLDADLVASHKSLKKLKDLEEAQTHTSDDIVTSHSDTAIQVNKRNATQDQVKELDFAKDQKKSQGTLKEEQDRVAALDDELDGDKSGRREMMKSLDTESPRPESIEAEQKMVAGMDDELEGDKSSMNKKLTMDVKSGESESESVQSQPETDKSTGVEKEKTVKRGDKEINSVNSEVQSNGIKINEKEGKKKKKKPKHKGKHKGNKTRKGKSDIRRVQLEKAGVLIPVTNKDEQNQKVSDNNHQNNPNEAKANGKNTPYSPKSISGKKTDKEKEPHEGNDTKSHDQKMATIDSAIAYLSGTKVPPGSKEQESKWQRVTSRYKNINGKNEVRNTDDPNSHPNSSKNAGLKLTSSKETRITYPPWQTLSSNNYRMPSKEERSNAKPPYYSDISSYDRPRDEWPHLSLESIKHGGNTDKQWSAISNMVNQQQKQHSKDDNEATANKIMNNWPKFPPDMSSQKENSVDGDNWPNFQAEHSEKDDWTKSSLESALSNHISSTWPQKEGSGHRTGGSRQWPHFAYHRVTSSPQVLAQQRARHRNAYIAVSVVAPPGKPKTLHKSVPASAGSSTNISSSENGTGSSTVSSDRSTSKGEDRPSQPLPDKIDQLLAMRSEQRAIDPLEEQLIDAAAATSRGSLPWSHARHLDRIQEQLKTLSAMEEKLRYHWLEKERLRQILRDGGKNGAGFYREPRDGSNNNNNKTGDITATASPTLMVTSPSPSTNSSNNAP